MTYDPWKDYKERERRHRRWNKLAPFILGTLLLSVAAADAYLVYKAHHAEQHIFIVPYTKLHAEPLKP